MNEHTADYLERVVAYLEVPSQYFCTKVEAERTRRKGEGRWREETKKGEEAMQ